MFDELKDPRPPQVTDVHIISVIARAHRIRRRQRMAMFTTTAAFAAGIGGLAFISRDHTTATTVTDFASAGASSEARVLPTPLLATTIPLPGTTLSAPPVADAVPAATEVPGATTLSVVPLDPTIVQTGSPGVANGVATTAPTVAAAVVATTIQAIAPPKTPMPGQFVAVTSDTGDLVRVDSATGATTVLVAATRPEPASASGTSTARFIAGGVTPDGATAYYSDSISGKVHGVTIAAPEAAPPAWGPGTNPKLSPNGTRWIALNIEGTISVHSKTETDQTLGTRPGSTVVDYAWFGDDEIALLEYDGKSWTVRVFDATLTAEKESPSTIDDSYVVGGPPAVTLRFVGRTINGLLLTAQRLELGPEDPKTLHLWVRPGPGSENRWSSLPINYSSIVVDRNGDWLLRLSSEGTLTTDAVGGHQELKVPGTFQSVAW